MKRNQKLSNILTIGEIMKMKVLVNGQETKEFHITLYRESMISPVFGDLHAIFKDGSEIKGQIIREIHIPLLHSKQHIYEMKMGRIAVEYLDEEGSNLVT